jgi:hypothetical protein
MMRNMGIRYTVYKYGTGYRQDVHCGITLISYRGEDNQASTETHGQSETTDAILISPAFQVPSSLDSAMNMLS